LAGLKSGRFELTDHYESPETDGWVSLAHFESRAYERQPPPADYIRSTIFCSYGDTAEPDPTHRSVQDPKRILELHRLAEKARIKPLKPRREEPTSDPLPEIFAILTAPFRLINQAVEQAVDLAGGLIAQVALVIIPVLLIVAIVVACIYAPPAIAIFVALVLYLRKRD
jgi:hypothetical protein